MVVAGIGLEAELKRDQGVWTRQEVCFQNSQEVTLAWCEMLISEKEGEEAWMMNPKSLNFDN